MIVQVAYGKTGLQIPLDDAWDVTVIEPRFVPPLPNPEQAIHNALQSPLNLNPVSDWVKAGEKVGIIFNDITRPTPNDLLVKALLAELPHIPAEQITLFNALGSHRVNTDAEIRELLGDELVERFTIIQNQAFDPDTQAYIGMSSQGHEIWINRQLLACDRIILTGFIEPSDIAGFSGGGKAIMPGMAGIRTILGNHGFHSINHPSASWGVTHGNPIYEEITEAAERAGAVFLLNVSLNKHKEITGVFAGELRSAHQAGCDFVRQSAMVAVDRPFDIVIASNSGYPLDLNLYQCIKGMGAAAQIVKKGGAILVVAECWDGIPDHGLYGQLLREAGSPQAVFELIQGPDFPKLDQWEAQIQAQIQMMADVYVHSGYLTDDQIRSALLEPAADLTKTLAALVERYGPHARIAVLPEGHQTVPYLMEKIDEH